MYFARKPMKQIAIRLDEEHLDTVSGMAKRLKVNRSAVLRRALERGLVVLASELNTKPKRRK